MPQIIDEYRKPSTSDKFAQAFSNFGQSVGRAIPQYLMEKENKKIQEQQQRQENEAIKKLTGQDPSGIRDPKIRQKLVEKTLENKEKQNKENNLNEAVFRLTGKDLSGLTPEMKKSYLDKYVRSPDHEKLKALFMKQGASEDDAELYSYLTTGGQTEFVKKLMEERKRGGQNILDEENLNQKKQNAGPGINASQENKTNPTEKFDSDLSAYLKKQDEGLLPSEKVARGKERFDTGLKQYQETGEKLRTLTRDKERIDILEDLNKSKKLPKDLQRLNIDEEGNLRLPFASSPEAQRYVKTLNEFSVGAKDTFGSRVTNFDLQQYLKRYPTLMNSEEGRKQLLEQMKIVNQINAVYYKNLKNVYDKAGGVRNIDADIAERFAEQLSEDKVNELSKRFKDIGQFSTKPQASEFEGKKIRDKETGEIFISDGTDWVPQEQ